MTAEAPLILRLIWQSFRDPAAVGAAIATLRLDRATLWQSLLLVTILSTLALALVNGGMTASPFGDGRPLAPYASAMILGASLTTLVFALYFTGRALGGQGRFAAALALVIWLEVLAIALRLAIWLVTLALGPVLAGPLPILGIGLLGFVLVQFTKALHGFATMGRALGTIALAVLGLGLGLSAIILIIDFASGGALRNA